ncbi:MAG: hypothetical protein R3A10_06755 [Caldilineaceae bacterium]
MYNEGISTSGDLIDLGTELDIIDKRSSFYNYGDLRLGRGENAKTFLRKTRRWRLRLTPRFATSSVSP